MKINRLEIDAFMAVGEVTIDLDSKGLVLIQGENEDDSSQISNGAGKSSIADALLWCLYNETARGDTGDEIVNRSLKKGTRVLAQLVDGDRTYNVIRHRKHGVHKNRVLLLDVTNPSDVIDMTQGTDKATQDVITKLVGCSSDVFKAAIYSGQEAHVDLPSLTDKSLKTIVEEAAGIDKMQEAYVIARNRLNEKKAQAQGIKSRVDSYTAALEATESSLEINRRSQVEYEEKRSAQVTEKIAQLKEAIAKVKEVNEKVASLNEPGLLLSKSQISARIASVDAERTELTALVAEQTKAKSNLSAAKEKLEEEKRQAARCKSVMTNVEAEVGTKCESCGHILEASDVSGRVDSLKAQAVGHINKAKDLARDVTIAENILEDVNQRLDTFKSGMTDLTAETQKLKEIDSVLAQINALKTEAKTLTETAKGYSAQLERLKTEDNPYKAGISTLEGKRDEIVKSIDALNVELAELEKAVAVAESVVEVFSPAGVRAHILDTVTPFLNDRTSRYLGVLSDGNIQAIWNTISKTAKGELREKFEIVVTSSTGGSSYRSLSGGEKRKVRLATALALQDLVSSRAAKPIRLWIGDEIDDAIDDAGLERLMTVLEEKAKEKGTVLIISHNQIRDWVRQHVIVRKRGGLSTMSGVLCVERDKVGE